MNPRVVQHHAANAPTGHRPTAQGCEARATLGMRSRLPSTPTGLRHPASRPQPRWGWGILWPRFPKVGAVRQPWALERKPLGLGSRLVAELHAQFAESAGLEQAIKVNLRGLGYP